MVPAAKPTLPELEDVIETESSGNVVPKDTTNIPITNGDNLKTSESLTASFTNNCVAKSKIITPKKNFIK